MAIKLNKNHSNLETIRRWRAGEATDIRVYNTITEKEKFRQEGEEFELQGIMYKKENGKIIKLTKSQGDIIREAIGTDICNNKTCKMQIKCGSKRDENFYHRTGLCENCLIEYETNLRILGIWEVYEKYKLSSYALGDLKDKKEKIKATVEYFSNDNGDIKLPCENGVGYE